MQVQTEHISFDLLDLVPEMDREFANLYKYLIDQRPYETDNFHRAALNFFDIVREDTVSHDQFFNNLSPLAFLHFKNEHWHKAERVWEFALRSAIEWEKRNPGEFIHKGTPFYFSGMAAISRGDLDRGYAFMHQSLEEDIQTHNVEHPQTPAFAFATLDYEKVNQAFRGWSLRLAESLQNFLESYRHSRGRTLLMDDFRAKFLIDPPDLDAIFLFTYTLGRLFLLNEVPKYTMQSRFVGQLQANLLFDLILVVNVILRTHNPGHRGFSMQMLFLAEQAELNLTQNMIQEQVNRAFKEDLESTLKDLLDGQYRFQDGVSPSPIEADLMIAYGFRNFGAHDVSSVPIIWQRFPIIRQRLFNVLFLAVETL
jgi:hypothetical protein